MKSIPELCGQYHVRREDERLELFEIVRSEFGTRSFLYPGRFVHFTPASIIPNATFVDTGKQVKGFFDDPQTPAFFNACKRCEKPAKLRSLGRDFPKDLPIERGNDLLISQYAGLVSERCKGYLRKGGVLVANNRHGDASLA